MKTSLKYMLIIGAVIVILALATYSYLTFFNKTNTSNTLASCQNLGQTMQKEICFKDLAISSKDFSICNMMSLGVLHSGVGTSCYEGVAKLRKSVSECQSVSDDYVTDACFKGVAEGTGDISICDNIAYSVDKYGCYIAVAFVNKDSSLCEKIERADMKSDCYFQFK